MNKRADNDNADVLTGIHRSLDVDAITLILIMNFRYRSAFMLLSSMEN